MDTLKKKRKMNKHKYSIKGVNQTETHWDNVRAQASSHRKTIESTVVEENADIRRRLVFRDEYLANKYETLISQEIRRNKLSPKNIEALKVLDEIMSTPDDMGEEWWEDYFTDLDKYRFTI